MGKKDDKMGYLAHIFEARHSLIKALECVEYNNEVGVVGSVLDLLGNYARAYSEKHNVNHG